MQTATVCVHFWSVDLAFSMILQNKTKIMVFKVLLHAGHGPGFGQMHRHYEHSRQIHCRTEKNHAGEFTSKLNPQRGVVWEEFKIK